MMHEPVGFDFRKWFRKELKTLMKGANTIIKSGEQHLPILLIYDYSGGVVPIAIAGDFGDVFSKETVAHMQKDVSSNVDKVAGVIFLTEIWTVEGGLDDKEAEPYLKGGSIKDHPRKMEAVMFSAMHGHEQLMAICKIDRKKQRLDEPKILDSMDKGARFEGRMTVDPPTKQ